MQTKQGYWFQTIRGTLGLCKEYGNDEINLSLKQAMHYQATDVTSIRHILEKKLYMMQTEPVLPKVAEDAPIMGRDLGYYVVIYDANSIPNTA